MRCFICNAILLPEEVKFNKKHEEWEPCNRCLHEIEEVFEDPLDEEEIDRLLIEEEGADENST